MNYIPLFCPHCNTILIMEVLKHTFETHERVTCSNIQCKFFSNSFESFYAELVNSKIIAYDIAIVYNNSPYMFSSISDIKVPYIKVPYTCIAARSETGEITNLVVIDHFIEFPKENIIPYFEYHLKRLLNLRAFS